MRSVVRCAAVAVAAISIGVPVTAVDTTAAVAPFPVGVESVAPARGMRVGVGHPVLVTFRGPVTNRSAAERALAISSTPAVTGTFEWLDSRTVQWVPDQLWPAHTAVSLSVGGTTTQFQTGAAVVGVADISDHTFTVSIDGARDGSPIPLPAPHHSPHVGEDGVLLATMGRPEYPTPVGRYSVLAKERDVTMDSSSVGIPVTAPDGYLLDVDYAVRITRRGLFVHSAPWAVASMGRENVSHGCISLVPAAAQWYFNTVTVGDPVIVQE
ncbi:L,D-transpeptidase [Mycobacterium sp. MYCO198283]|uniref:L,D-transpeptidase n=1 Tax=Mycobacterium sp. MYCO198283 TaxID=2883505 RepID=UPI001E54C061|nr:L,D-transpeptidase [Mycobacterium sp. MYCO198283]MCG5434077.1 L,D-transpeptidase [Mycobacterium sp. MYCO198283]